MITYTQAIALAVALLIANLAIALRALHALRVIPAPIPALRVVIHALRAPLRALRVISALRAPAPRSALPGELVELVIAGALITLAILVALRALWGIA